MKRSTKILAMVVAIVFVAIAMTIVIYSATAGNTNISANVSWVSQSAVDLEFWAMVTGGSENKTIAKTQITPSTTNQQAGIVGDLSCNFKDSTDDGINNPSPITFKYYVKNNSLTPLNIMVTKTPDTQDESGTSPADHKPKVEIVSTAGGLDVLGDVVGTLGYNLSAGDTFVYTVIVSLSSGGTADVDADMEMTTKFDAGVTFNFNVATSSNGYISTIIDNGTPTTVASNTVSGRTLGDYLDSKSNGAYTTGWFFDKELTKVVTENNLKSEIKNSANASLYTRTASVSGLNFTLSSDGKSYLVSGQSSTSPSGEVVIPSMYNGKPVSGFVTGDDVYAFKQNKNITKVILPNTITIVGARAFGNCSNLASINLPDSLIRIGGHAFENCTKITSIELPNSLISIGYMALSGSSITSLTIPESVRGFGLPLHNCDSLTTLVVNKGNPIYDSRDNCNAVIETASNKLVQGCKTSVIPNTVTQIGDSAFYLIEITSIVIPDSVTSIGNTAFYWSGLTSVTVPDSVVSLGNAVFSHCFDLKTVKLGSGITEIPRFAFSSCLTLESVNIPDSVTDIGILAFRETRELKKIYIPKSVTTILTIDDADEPAPLFDGNTFSLKIYCGASSQPDGWGTYWNYYNTSSKLSVTWDITRAEFDAL